MQFQYPHTIDNGAGERLTYKRIVKDTDGERLEIEAIVDQPNAGPPMHVHFKQEEGINILKGKMGSQVAGQEAKYHSAGETLVFAPGVPHRFWNAGSEPLIGSGWLKPPNNFEYFLAEIYKSTAANGGKRPGTFDAAYLLDRYRSEFDMLDIPGFVKKVIFPVALFFGKMQGKHRKFEGAPIPLR